MAEESGGIRGPDERQAGRGRPDLWAGLRAVARSLTPGDYFVGLGLVLVLGLAPAAVMAAERASAIDESSPVVSAVKSSVASGPDVAVQHLPVGMPEGLEVDTPDDVRPLAVDALGETAAAELASLLDADPAAGPDVIWTAVADDDVTIYPYSYPPVEAILDQAPLAAWVEHGSALGVALVLLASVRDDAGEDAYANAAPAAFAVLHRLSSAGQCADLLNLLLVVASDSLPRDDDVVAAAERATAACPDDPTPEWLLGQFQSLRAMQLGILDIPSKPPPDAADRALETFAALLERFPASADVVAGAADAHAREGARLQILQPFTARHEFRTAEQLYRRALTLSKSPEIGAGLARALLGLGEAEAALRLLGSLEAAPSTQGFRLELTVAAAESAHDWDTATETARDLAALGRDAYATGPPFFPGPSDSTTFQGDPIDIPMVSVGLDGSTLLELDLAPIQGGGGGVVDDTSYIPAYREDLGYTGLMGGCPAWGWRRDAVLAGRAAEALEGLPAAMNFPSHRTVNAYSCTATYWLDERTRDLIRLEAGESVALSDKARRKVADHRQNLWRWAGDLDRAAEVVEEWRADEAEPSSLASLRLGEIRYLQGRFDEAAAAFAAAGRATRRESWDDDLAALRVSLARSAALVRADREDDAIALLEAVAAEAESGSAYQAQEQQGFYETEFAAVAYHARSLLGDTLRANGSLSAALENYQAALELLPLIDAPFSTVTGHRPERLYGNLSVTQLAAGLEAEAEESVGHALEADPMNPAFLMNAGFIADHRDDPEAAVDYNRRALESDPGAFPAANDLGVQLARLGRPEDALVALAQAVRAEPDYALGWFNLGVVHAELGLGHFLASQGSFARAIALDPDLADRERELTIDANVYRTELDLSKPLPPRWSLSQLDVYAPAASAGLLAALLLGLALARTSSPGGTDLAARWSDVAETVVGRIPWLNRVRAPAWALLLTVVVFLATVLRQGAQQPIALACYAAGVAVLAGAAVRVRALVGRASGEHSHQVSWPPGMLLGAGSAVVGVPWAPLPVLDRAEARPRLHAAAPFLLTAVTIPLLVEAAWLDVPLTHSLAVAALVMAASTLVPVPPLDGGSLDRRQLLAGAGVVGAATLTLFGLL